MTTRKEIESEYNVDANGIIRNPGKFEGQSAYVPHFWDMVMNGFGDTHYDNGTPIDFFDVLPTDRDEFPELGDVKTVALWEDESGFVHCELDATSDYLDWAGEYSEEKGKDE